MSKKLKENVKNKVKTFGIVATAAATLFGFVHVMNGVQDRKPKDNGNQPGLVRDVDDEKLNECMKNANTPEEQAICVEQAQEEKTQENEKGKDNSKPNTQPKPNKPSNVKPTQEEEIKTSYQADEVPSETKVIVNEENKNFEYVPEPTQEDYNKIKVEVKEDPVVPETKPNVKPQEPAKGSQGESIFVSQSDLEEAMREAIKVNGTEPNKDQVEKPIEKPIEVPGRVSEVIEFD